MEFVRGARPVGGRVALAVSACALALLATPTGASAMPSGSGQAGDLAKAHASINTYKFWDSEVVQPFGRPKLSTFGQVVKVPDGDTSLDKFTFWMASETFSGSLVLRFEVYAWDGTKATGPALYESAPRTLTDLQGWNREGATTGGVTVVPGQDYVVFASVDKDWEQCEHYLLEWAAVTTDRYPDGTWVYQKNAGDETQWTQKDWTGSSAALAFKAYLS